MNALKTILDVASKAMFLFLVFAGTISALSLVRWLADRPKPKPKSCKAKQVNPNDKPNHTKPQVTGGRSLGRSSPDDLHKMKAARSARLANNRFQMTATMAKNGTRKIIPRSKTPPSSSSSKSYVPPPSPRSVVIPPPTLPAELRPESTQHFFVDGATKFLALPPMANLPEAVEILQRLSQEFLPIVRKRGFNVRSVSEMCCCGDGLEHELGGERRSVAAGESVVGNDHDSVMGYNGKLIDRRGKPEYVIHLRLRTVEDHTKFLDYEEDIVDTMAHELAHCVFEDHGPGFWGLMEEILEDRKKVVQGLQRGGRAPHDPAASSMEQFQGFDIYTSVRVQMRNWNGQMM